MGCDIHLFVEARRNGKWEREVVVPERFRDPWYVEQAAKHPDGHYRLYAERQWYRDRNYEAFAVLAGVRNDGFITPIAEPRGWPSDLSDGGQRLIRNAEDPDGEYDENDIGLGDHSASWLTLAELQAYPWGGRALQGGVVTLQAFMERCAKHGMGLPVEVDRAPYKGWSGDIWGRDIVVRNAKDVLTAIANGGLAVPEGERTHVRDEWSMPVAAQMHGLTTRLIPALASLGLSPDDVRIVFNFDS